MNSRSRIVGACLAWLGVFACVGVARAGEAVASADAPPRVRVQSGWLEGAREQGLAVFRGIPYAAPPTGALRWRAPAPVRAWRGVRPATAFGARCAQRRVFDDMVFRSPDPAEDCLYLNVWTSDAGARPGMPVLVYIHGGGYVAGDGSEPRYDGAHFARDGIVTVTLNHRLGAFGFLAHRLLRDARGASGNYGLMDQVAALRWVRENIAAFGGDPRRVTIAGESAGSVSVSALMVAPSAQGLFAGAIGESGALHGTLRAAARAACEATGDPVVKAAGVHDARGLRALSTEQVLKAGDAVTLGGFVPCVDGTFYREEPRAAFAAGRVARVPLLAGYNSAEGDYDGLLGAQAPTPAAWRALLEKTFGSQADEALRYYPGATAEEVARSARTAAGDQFIAHGTWMWAQEHAALGVPTWFYRYERPRPGAPGSVPRAGRVIPDGATHSAEIEYAMGNLGLTRAYDWGDADWQVSQVMHRQFAQFVRTGNPNGTGLPQWPPMAAGQLMVIDVQSHAEADASGPRQRFLAEWFTRAGAQAPRE